MRVLREQWRILRRDSLALGSVIVLLLFLLLALLGSKLAPYGPGDMVRDGSGNLLSLQPPTWSHPLGTTDLGNDVLSQLMVGARVAVTVGFVAALVVTLIGMMVGLLSGYYGGWVDEGLMRIVDIAYSLPFEPVAITILALVSPSYWSIILAVSLLMWRAPARVIRTQVMDLVHQPYVKAARVAGASDLRILLQHIAPNVLTVGFVYVATSFGNAVLAEATVTFLGFGDPTSVSWGSMLQRAYAAGAIRQAWWWVLPPGLCIALLVSGIFFLTRAYDEVVNPRLRRG